MRMPTIERRRRPSNRRILLIALAAVVGVLLVSLRGIAGFYTDYLWFKELGYTEVWRGLLLAKALPSAVFTIAFFLLILGNMIIADRLQPRYRPAGPEEELVERYRQFIGPYAGRVRLGVAAFLAVVAASGLTSQWNAWILFRNRVPFGGPGDPQFGADIGFYVFTLPFLRYMFEWTFAALVIVLLVTAVSHYLNGGIRVQGPLQRVTPQVKAHRSVLLGAMALLKAFGYWLQRFDLNFSTRGVVEGASYTDVKAQLPALNMLIVISIAAAVLFFVNRWLKGWVLPIIAVGLWSFVSVVIGSIYPTIVQKASVEPNELQKENRYIQRNINATRAAFGLNNVAVKDFSYKEDLGAAAIRANEGTIDDIRLWDPHVLVNTYTPLQQLRPQYTFSDVDIDRYRIDGELRQVLIAAREIDLARLPSQTWQNRHLVYTHGYGIVASPSNGVDFEHGGAPEFLVKDMPPQGSIEVTQPAIYFGENLSGYAFVNTKLKEFDYPRQSAEGDATTTYGGKGGVKVGNILRRTALFLRFADIKVLISGQITSNSRALYLRDIRDRVGKAAPFLKFDADPYPVVVNGRILWVIDGYTTSDRYPYSQSYVPTGNRLDNQSGLRTGLNYVRNSIKATIDAYDGTTKFYVFDDLANPDPIVKAYRKAFPKLFTDRSQMPAGLVEHLRYPEDLFRVQSDRFAAYHVTEPPVFYQNARAWAVAQNPDAPAATASTTAPQQPASPGRPAVTPTRRDRMEPYYLQMRLPGQPNEGFLILQPFVPVATGDREPTNLASFLVAKSDPGEYGRLEAYTMPAGTAVEGPAQIDSLLNSTPEYSTLRSLLSREGSLFVQGSLLLIPIEQSILYVRPVYVQGAGDTKLPQFRRLAAVYGNRAVISDTLPGVLSQLFPDLGPAPPAGSGGGLAPPTGGGPPVATDVPGLLAQAETAYNDAQTALKAGNLADYQKAVDRLGELIRQATAISGAPTTTTTATTGP